jgi:hypothetical protein
MPKKNTPKKNDVKVHRSPSQKDFWLTPLQTDADGVGETSPFRQVLLNNIFFSYFS